MRARNIKPGFFKNEYLAECDPLARILFAGLWCMADREGRLEDRPKRIKIEILPYDNCNLDKLLNQLCAKQFIQRYEFDSSKYIQILNFQKHQNPHMRELKSDIPEPPEHCPSTMLDPDENRTGPADSLNLNPESLYKPSSPKNDLPASYLDVVRIFQEKQRDELGNLAPKVTEKLIHAGANEIRLLVKDGFGFDDEIKPALRFALTDNDFWKDKVRSVAGVRKKSKNGLSKFANLLAASKSHSRNGNSKPPKISPLMEAY